MKPLKIVFASSEVAPFAKTGGLADVSASLPAALAERGHSVSVVMPLYRSVREGNFGLKQVDQPVEVLFRGQVLESKVFVTFLGKNLSVYFLERDEFFDRSMLYGTPAGDYFDNAERFVYFSRGVLQMVKRLGVPVDIIHVNDWQTSLVPVYLKTLFSDDVFFLKTRTLLTIHNLAYQGIFPRETMGISDLPARLFSIDGLEFYGKMNFLKGGILFADAVNTVSEKYAQEIRTPEYGHKLEGVLRERGANVFGVLNGVDYSEWNPENDSHIKANYSPEDVAGKARCREDLLKIFKLQGAENSPVLGVISRLADQKGFDILAAALDKILETGALLVVLGKGDERYETLFADLARKHRGRLGVRVAFDNPLAHKIEAGADMFLMPSRYEPCGLNQMYSLKYGTIPVVRATGGLDDTITEYDPKTGQGNGFKFSEYSSEALLKSLQKAFEVYHSRKHWSKLVANAMKEDFSWARSARKYVEIYSRVLVKK